MISKKIIENQFGELYIICEQFKGTTIDVFLPLRLLI